MRRLNVPRRYVPVNYWTFWDGLPKPLQDWRADVESVLDIRTQRLTWSMP